MPLTEAGGQVVGILAALLTISSWQWKTQAGVLAMLIAGGALWGLSYGLLDDTVPAIGNLLGVIPTVAYARNWRSRHMLNAICASIFVCSVSWHWIAAGAITTPFEDVPSAIGLCLYYFALTRTPNQFRLIMACTLVFWFFNNLACRSAGGLVLNLVEGISMASGYFRSRAAAE